MQVTPDPDFEASMLDWETASKGLLMVILNEHRLFFAEMNVECQTKPLVIKMHLTLDVVKQSK